VRKAVRNKGFFPSHEAAIALIHLALRDVQAKWTRPAVQWHPSSKQFFIQLGDRFTLEA